MSLPQSEEPLIRAHEKRAAVDRWRGLHLASNLVATQLFECIGCLEEDGLAAIVKSIERVAARQQRGGEAASHTFRPQDLARFGVRGGGDSLIGNHEQALADHD